MPAAGVVGGLASSLIASDSARSAANKQADANRAALSAQQAQAEQARADSAPWRDAGGRALALYEQQLGQVPTAAEVMAQPGYQFGLQQGMQALDRKIAASGGRVSGAALKAASQYGTDYATQGYGTAYQRGQDRLNRLASLAQLGQTAASGASELGQVGATQLARLYGQQGTNAAQGTMAQGNIWGNALNRAIGQYQAQGGQNFFGSSPSDSTGYSVPQSSATKNALYGAVGYGER